MVERSKLEGLKFSFERNDISKLFDKELSKFFVSDKKLAELFNRMTNILEYHKLGIKEVNRNTAPIYVPDNE